MKRSFLMGLSFALLLVGVAACGGGKSAENAANTAASAAGNAAGNAMNSASNAAGNAMNSAGNTMKSMKNGAENAMGGDEMGKMPNCGAVKPVWVNLNSKAYHEPGDPYYGKTKHGEYLCPSQAKAQGFHPAGGGKTSQ